MFCVCVKTLVFLMARTFMDKIENVCNTNKKQKNFTLLEGMDIYLPHVDGVITCMHQYCTHASKDISVTAIAPYDKGQYDDKLPYEVIRCRSIFLPFLGYRYCRATKDKQFYKKVMQKDFDIVHVNSPFNMADFAIKVARAKGVPAVATFHSNMRPIFKSIVKVNWIAEKMVAHLGKTYNKFDEVFVCSPIVAEQCRSFGYTGKISYLPFGTKLPKCHEKQQNIEKANATLGISQDEIVFIYVGRLEKLKRIDFTLKSLKILKDKGLKFKFYIVGKGQEGKKLKKLCKKLGLTENEVIFTGFVAEEQFPLLYSRADLLLFPSLYDNFGLVKVEAASFDTPGVFIEGSCAGYGVTHGVNGYLSQDNVTSFADTIEKALSDRNALKQVGVKAGEDLYISWEDCTKQFVNRLKEITERYENDNKK